MRIHAHLHAQEIPPLVAQERRSLVMHVPQQIELHREIHSEGTWRKRRCVYVVRGKGGGSRAKAWRGGDCLSFLFSFFLGWGGGEQGKGRLAHSEMHACTRQRTTLFWKTRQRRNHHNSDENPTTCVGGTPTSSTATPFFGEVENRELRKPFALFGSRTCGSSSVSIFTSASKARSETPSAIFQ